MVELNMTTSAISSMNPVNFGWIITIILFFCIGLFLFVLSKNFRKFVIGIPITMVLLIIYFVSRYIGVSSSSGNFEPLKWLVYIIGFCVISTFIGHFLTKNKKINYWIRELVDN